MPTDQQFVKRERSRNSSLPDRSNAKTALAAERPFDSVRAGDARYVTVKLAFQRQPPRHERKAEPVVNLDEASGGEVQAPPIRSGDVLAFSEVAMGKAGLCRDLGGGRVDLTPTRVSSRSRGSGFRPCGRDPR